MALPSSHAGGSTPFITLRRVALAELPLRNFIERPPSPLKSYSSPGKIQPPILASPKPKSHSPSPSRPSSIHVDLTSKHQLFREALRKSDNSILVEKSSPTEDQIASPPKLVKPAARQVSSSSSSSQQPMLPKSPSTTSPFKKGTMSAPQTLGKKKERVRRQLLDEDEDGGADVDIRAGSPSPSKMKAEREGALRGSASNSSHHSAKEQKKREVLWTVWQDEEVADPVKPSEKVLSAGESGEEELDKENVGPSTNFNTTGRKKGTGGRLSLLATGDDTEAEQTIDSSHDKRRRVTPLGPV